MDQFIEIFEQYRVDIDAQIKDNYQQAETEGSVAVAGSYGTHETVYLASTGRDVEITVESNGSATDDFKVIQTVDGNAVTVKTLTGVGAGQRSVTFVDTATRLFDSKKITYDFQLQGSGTTTRTYILVKEIK